MAELLSVILPAYNPNASRISQTLSGLKNQTLDLNSWELILIDNNSNPPLSIDLGWHPKHKILTEKKPGLTYARLTGFENALAPIVLMVDDDNVLDKDYLENALAIFNADSSLGAIGGKSIPQFEAAPPPWLGKFYANIALRDLGEEALLTGWKNEYPAFAPIGAGMGIRKEALKTYLDKIKSPGNVIADRTGNSLSSGGDNDIVLEILKSGWQVGYYPSLVLKHIIPASRMEASYLARLLKDTNKSWVQLLESHHINPWKKIASWTVPLRKIKSWFSYRAWSSKASYIKWQGACGIFDGLASINKGANT
jgi:glycosyltransferase involved in cell wall biosynthesis